MKDGVTDGPMIVELNIVWFAEFEFNVGLNILMVIYRCTLDA